jgi:hypothetical protein
MSKAPQRPYSRLSAAQRDAITRKAKREGKDPARVHAAYKGLETRRKREYREAVRHGKRARQKTERTITPEQFAQRATRARATKRRTAIERLAPPEPISLATLGRIRDDDYYIEVEGHHEQDEATGEIVGLG